MALSPRYVVTVEQVEETAGGHDYSSRVVFRYETDRPVSLVELSRVVIPQPEQPEQREFDPYAAHKKHSFLPYADRVSAPIPPVPPASGIASPASGIAGLAGEPTQASVYRATVSMLVATAESEARAAINELARLARRER